MAAPTESMDFEQRLAQKLACNDRTVRDRAVKKLRKYLEARSQSQKNAFSRDDMIKIWKGLHYCMWMSDKPLVQEDLAELIGSLIHNLKTPDSAFMFLDTFFETEFREWYGIDRLRIDKFMLMIRMMFQQSLVLVKNGKWSKKLVKQFLDVLSKDLLAAGGNAPIGVRTHIIDIFYAELTKVGTDELTSDQVMTFFEPFIQLYARGNNKKQMNRFFMEIIIDSDVGLSEARAEKREEEPPRLNLDYTKMADRLFKVASSDVCKKTNRDNMYGIIKKFRNLAVGIFPRDRIPDDDEDELGRNDIDKAVASLLATEGNKDKKRKRKRKNQGKQDSDGSDDDDAAFSDEAEEEGEAPPPKKKKKGKQKQADATTGDKDADATTTESSQKKNTKSKADKISKPQDTTAVEKPGKSDSKKIKSKAVKATSIADVKHSEESSVKEGKSEKGTPKDSAKKKKNNKENTGKVNEATESVVDTAVTKDTEDQLELLKKKVTKMCDDNQGGEKTEKSKKKRRKSAGDALSTITPTKKQKTDLSDTAEQASVIKDVKKSAKARRKSVGSFSEVSKSAESSTPDVQEKKFVKIKKKGTGDESGSKVEATAPVGAKKSDTPVSAYAKMLEKKTKERKVSPSSGSKKKQKAVNFDSSSELSSDALKSPEASDPMSSPDAVMSAAQMKKKWEKTRLDTPASVGNIKKKKRAESVSPVHEFDFLTPTDSSGKKKKRLSGTPVVTSGGKKGKTPLTNITEESPESSSPKKLEKNLFMAFEKVKTPPAVFVKKATGKATPKGKNETPLTSPPSGGSTSEKKKKKRSKRVSFIMARNMEQEFKDSLNVSPAPPFQPEKKPENGILKSPIVTPKQVLRAKQVQALLKQMTPNRSPLAKSPKSVQRMMQKQSLKKNKRSSL